MRGSRIGPRFAPHVLCALIAVPTIVTSPPAGDPAARLGAVAEAATRRLDEWLQPLPLQQLTVVVDGWNSPRAADTRPGEVAGVARWLHPAAERAADRLLVDAIAREYWTETSDRAQPADWFFAGVRRYSAIRAIHASFLGSHDYAERHFGGFVPYVVATLPLSLTPEDPRPQVRRFDELDRTVRDADAVQRMVDAMSTLERTMGWPTIQQALAAFLDRSRGRRPARDEFVAVLNEVSGRDLTAFFADVQRADARFDYAVSACTSASSGSASHPYETSVTVNRLGEASFPDGVEIAVSFADGSETRERWTGSDRAATFRLASRSPARAVQVDPDRILLLDADRENNSCRLSSASWRPALRWLSQWVVWLQNVMLTYGTFA